MDRKSLCLLWARPTVGSGYTISIMKERECRSRLLQGGALRLNAHCCCICVRKHPRTVSLRWRHTLRSSLSTFKPIRSTRDSRATWACFALSAMTSRTAALRNEVFRKRRGCCWIYGPHVIHSGIVRMKLVFRLPLGRYCLWFFRGLRRAQKVLMQPI